MFYGSESRDMLMSGGAFAVTRTTLSVAEQEGQLDGETVVTGAPSKTISSYTKSVKLAASPTLQIRNGSRIILYPLPRPLGVSHFDRQCLATPVGWFYTPLRH